MILTSRDEKKGAEAIENLKASKLSDVAFHQLDVKDPASIASLARFVETKFKKLDILVRKRPLCVCTYIIFKGVKRNSRYITVFFFFFDLIGLGGKE